tara:strand:+ start:15509 stop:15865 length:357 start_codon:yes stop_codon:yes gene_type:complete
MKKVFIVFSLFVAFTSCKNNEESSAEAQEIKADFIYLDDAAVLKGTDFIYGVKIDDMAKELAERVNPIKIDDFDMVPVVVKGIINKKEENEEGWEEIVTIKEIVTVSNRPSQPDVKLE